MNAASYLAELRELAGQATQGEWQASLVDDHLETTSAVYARALPPGSEIVGTTRKYGGIWKRNDAAHIAAFDPPTALALITALEAVLNLVEVMDDGVSPECSGFADKFRGAIDAALSVKGEDG